eukprot:scaffold2480_cov385-Prasinococcus_capsulatus_cf.AAC.13
MAEDSRRVLQWCDCQTHPERASIFPIVQEFNAGIHLLVKCRSQPLQLRGVGARSRQAATIGRPQLLTRVSCQLREGLVDEKHRIVD